jgi:hypothetical protein
VSGSGTASAGCDTRHAYNRTKATWNVSFNNSSTCEIGSRKGSRCNVDPGQVAELHYDDWDLGNAKITFSTQINPNRCNKGKTAQGRPPCIWSVTYRYNMAECRILHNGNTGPVVLNDPATGDVVFYSLP